MHLEIDELTLAQALSTLSTEEQQQFFATMKAILGLPLNFRETLKVSDMAVRFAENNEPELAGMLQGHVACAMQLGG